MKNIELGQYTGSDSQAQAISNFLEHKYEDKFIFVLLKRNTSLGLFALYDGLSNFCSCGKIELGKGIFCKHMKLKRNVIIPMNSQVNRPFWMDWSKFRSDNLESLFCYLTMI